MSRTRRPIRTAVLVALLSLPAACDRPAPRADAARGERRWSELAASGVRWRAGAEFVVATHEGRPGGVRSTRERWVLLRRDSLTGEFERVREAGRPTVVTLPLHPAAPGAGGGAHAAARRGRDAATTRLERVGVPAGRFRCGHTVRTREERDGRMMRVDEWWAPGLPVPVQRWSRWEGVVDTLREPPRRVADVRVGTTWTVLEIIRRP